MKRTLTWTKFKLPPSGPSIASLDDDEDDGEEKSVWELSEEKKYKSHAERLESLIGGSKILSTPLGSVHLDGTQESERLFNVWVGHTNFNLTDQHYSLIEPVQGVEALQPISRYRFQVAVGFAFDENKVKTSISEALVGSLRKDMLDLLHIYGLQNEKLTKKISQKLESQIALIKDRYWISLALPGGQIKLIVSDEINDDFITELNLLGVVQSTVGGTIDSNLLRAGDGEE